MVHPEVSLIVSTFQMPRHLSLVLASIARQTVRNRIEIIVTDDGSADHTREVVQTFSAKSGLPVQFVTHPHAGFHLTRCRNDGARAATAPYLLFLDGDCVIPPDHVEQYLAARRSGIVHFGYCYRMPQDVSERIDEAAIAAGEFVRWAPRSEWWKLAKLHAKSLLYQTIGHAKKPLLKGGNVGIWRTDYERLNGYDENFHAWGCEDDDLSYRVRAAGLRVASILGRTCTYHLWHPPATSKPAGKWSQGQNVAYLQRRGRLTCCMNGLRKRTLYDLKVAGVGQPSDTKKAQQFVATVFGSARNPSPAEVELLFLPGDGKFSGQAACNVVAAADPLGIPTHVRRSAHIVVPDDPRRATAILAAELPLPPLDGTAVAA